jgi:hypothetical protein
VQIPVLLIAYRRADNVAKILLSCIAETESKIYVVIDAPSNFNDQVQHDVRKTVETVSKIAKEYPGRINYVVRAKNVGCAASVLSACEWFFMQEEFGIILEDDCIPSESFFSLVESARHTIESNTDIWMVCGSQFAPVGIFNSGWALSSYPLIWGWATSRSKWSAIRDSLINPKRNNQNLSVGIVERTYWRAGGRRASVGMVDVWDTLLVQQMMESRALAILPSESLVTNLGNDIAATHTHGSSEWLNRKTGSFQPQHEVPKFSEDLNSWLKHSFYKISFRHLFTTRITFILDLIGINQHKLKPLSTRWLNAMHELEEAPIQTT